MSIYLSIDLDYWNKLRDYSHMVWFLKKAIQSTNNIKIVDSHEELIKHVNNSGCERLINVDYHSDISNRYDTRFDYGDVFNCGTWVSFVKFGIKKQGQYTWMMPYALDWAKTEGYCHSPADKSANPFVNPKVSGWLKTNQISINEHYPEKLIEWDKIGGVGIAFSYEWLDNKTEDEIVKRAVVALKTKPLKNNRCKLH